MTASRDWLGRTELHLECPGAAYCSGAITPVALVDELAPALDASDRLAIWIHRTSIDDLRSAALALERGAARGPLWGVPFAVKDNIDVAGVPTTAACPAYAYVPASSAAVVERLIAAGALLVGKTNLDQFATGLVGVRSPHGAPPNRSARRTSRAARARARPPRSRAAWSASRSGPTPRDRAACQPR